MLFLSCCAVLAIVALHPETPIGKVLRRFLVDLPAERLVRLKPATMVFVLLVIALSVAAILYSRSDGVAVAAQAPEALGWFFAFDIGTYIDVIALAWLAASAQGIRVIYRRLLSALAPVWRMILARVGGFAARSRSPRRRPTAPPPTSDDEGWFGAGFAFA